MNTRHTARSVALSLWALSGCGDGGAGPQSMPAALEVQIEARFDEAASQGFAGVGLVIVQGETLFSRGYGLADRASQRPNELTTAFDFGSLMKELTAAAIFKLEAAGVLSASDSLSKWFADVPADKASITLAQLVQHRSGLREYPNTKGDTLGDFEPLTREQARANIFAQKLAFEPGSKEAYSNAGYTLLADVIETATGGPFTTYIHTELLQPAGMLSSGFYRDAIWETVDTAIGYEDLTFQDNDPATWPLTWALIGNGGLVATAPDIARWLVAVRDGSVLSASALARYEAEYLALAKAMLGGKPVYGYAGAGDYGLGGVAVDCPEDDTRFVIATNQATEFDIEEFASDLAKFVCAGR